MFSEKTTEDQRHELEIIDAVVRGGGEARPEDAALVDFALLVRNARPVPDHGEAMRLDDAVAAPRQGASRKSGFSPLLAIAASCLLLVGVAGVAVSTIGNSTQGLSLERNAPDGAVTETSAERDFGVASDAAKAVAPSSAQMQKVAPLEQAPSGGADRDVARTARLTLAAQGDRIERIADRVNAVTDASGGYVADSQVRSVDESRGRASFLLMIPAAHYQSTLAQLSKLAHVRSRTQSSTDVTAESNAAERLLAQRQARVKVLEARLAQADTPPQRAAAAHNLARAELAERQAAKRVRAIRNRVNYVPLSVTLVADKAAADADKGTIAKAVDRAGKILTGTVAVLIIALAVAVPIAFIVAALWWGGRRWRRDRADRAIGEAAAQPE